MLLTDLLVQIFSNTEAELISEIFIYLIGIVFLISITLYWLEKSQRFVVQAPVLLTSLGILGTFAGIFVGLLGFDTNAIDQSVPPLLAGMKTAFLSSVLGIASSMLFGVITTITPRKVETEEIIEASPEAILEAIKEQTRHSKSLLDAIEGSHEGSIIGELKLLRGSVQDFEKNQINESHAFKNALWVKLDGFAEMMSKSATEQVIDALKEVIVEFNQRLTEQFGENFKRLDDSVQKLVDWQENYRLQLLHMIDLYSEGVTSINQTKDAVASVAQSTERIPTDMKKLGAVLEINQNQIERLADHLEVFVQMRDMAIKAVPHIQSQVEDVGKQLKEGAANMKIVILEGATEFKDSVDSTNRGMADMARSIANGADEISSEIGETVAKLGNTSARIETVISTSVSQSMEQIKRNTEISMQSSQQAVESTAEHLKNSTDSILKENARALQSQLSNAQKSMRQLVETGFSDMGSALGEVVKHIRTQFFAKQ